MNSRRGFLRDASMALGGAWLAVHLDEVLAAGQAAARATGWKVLEAAEVAALAAFADRVFPPSDTPGAAELGAVRFLDNTFDGFMAGVLPMVREGIADLDARARALDAAAFSGLDAKRQAEVMRQVEATPFFSTLHFLVLCGLFAMPGHGGNRDGAAWALLGFESRHAWQPPFGFYDAAVAGEGSDGA